MKLGRRQFTAMAGGALASLTLGGACHAGAQPQGRDGRISARPGRGAGKAQPGTTRLGLDPGNRDASLLVPAHVGEDPLPLMVLLHGAGGSGEGILRRLGSYVAEAGIVALAPDSRAATWDGIRGDLGPDVAFLDRALGRVFEIIPIDPQRISIGGFSDGATYALSVGLRNGDLFRSLVAYSPGFYSGGTVHGKPRIYVSHGTDDEILPIDRCSRVIVSTLKRQGYDVTFRTFIGGHEIPSPVAKEGMRFAKAG